VRVNIIFGGVKSHGGVEERMSRSEAVEFESAIQRAFKVVAEAVIFIC